MKALRLKRYGCLLIAGAFVAMTAMPSRAQQQGQYNQTGVLSCRLAPTIGLIVGSRQSMACQFRPDKGGLVENYSGAITKIGLDLGITAGGAMAWAVLASAAVPVRGGLAGTYVGASGSISLGVGAGANVLIGGSNRSVALQPVSIEGSVGVNLALGVANLELRAVP